MGKKGFILPLVIMASFVLLILAFTLGGSGSANLFQIRTGLFETTAFYAARSGIANAFYGIENGVNIPTACACNQSPSCSATTCTNASYLSNVSMSNRASFSVSLTNNQGSGLFPVTAPDGATVPAGMIYISSTGNDHGYQKTDKVLATSTTGFPYTFMAFGGNKIVMNGNAVTDSYNSNNGLYGGTNSNLGNGNLGVNSAATGAVTMNGNDTVNGTIRVGAGGTAGSPTITTNGNDSYTNASVLGSNLSMPSATDPLNGPGTTNASSGLLPPGKYGDITVSGSSTLTLTCGTYSINSLTVTGSGQVIIDPTCTTANPVKIYDYNGLTLEGQGVVNAGDASTHLLIYGMPSLSTATVSAGNGVAAYALYAPKANLEVKGNGDIYGTLIGNTVTFDGNAKGHYDQALTTDLYTGLTSTTINVQSWNLR